MSDMNRPSAKCADSAVAGRLLHVPSLNFFGVFLWEAAWVTCLWFIVYAGADWVTSLHHYRISLHTQIDSKIPFIPAAAIFYLSLFPMTWLAPFILHTPRQLRAFARGLAMAILLAGIGFLFLPVEPPEVHSAGAGLSGQLFHFADSINLKYNLFPSLHVAMAVVCAASFSCSKSPGVKIFFWLWAVAIALSTVLTHQHYLSDAIAGALLGIVVSPKRLLPC
jgi:membrane-associated phospholipid phosphatase